MLDNIISEILRRGENTKIYKSPLVSSSKHTWLIETVQFDIVSTHQVETPKNSVTKVVTVMKEFTVPVPAYCEDLLLSRGELNIRLRTQGLCASF